jgi:hypothetical protein
MERSVFVLALRVGNLIGSRKSIAVNWRGPSNVLGMNVLYDGIQVVWLVLVCSSDSNAGVAVPVHVMRCFVPRSRRFCGVGLVWY